MKKFVGILFLIISFVSVYNYGQQNIVLKPGTKLIYSVFRNGEYSNIILTINTVFPDLDFTYQTTFDPMAKGEVTMSQNALHNADRIIYYLLGRNLNLDNATFLWFSQKSYNNLINTGRASITSENGKLISLSKLNNSVKKIIEGNDTIYVNYTNAAQVLGDSTTEIDYGDTYQILDDPNNPMILKMDVGWTVDLKKIIFPGSNP